jgi:hypothetical protein
LVSKHYTTVSMIRTIVDVLGMESPGLNDALAEPMAEIFNSYPEPWSYTAQVPAVLYGTQLPLPAPSSARATGRASDRGQAGGKLSPGAMPPDGRPLRTAEYWERAMAGQNFEREDDLSTDAFNRALWVGLRGEDVLYPQIRHGRDLRRNRQQLLKQYYSRQSTQQSPRPGS